MIIIWGTKIKRRKMGRRADFCAICRRVRAFVLERVESVTHLYYIPIGGRTIQGMVRTCEACRVCVGADLSDAESATRDRHLDLRGLTSLTNPEIQRNCSSRFDLESRLKTRQLRPEEREYLLVEPFVLLKGVVAEREAHLHFDKVSSASLLAAIAVPLIFYLAAPRLLPEGTLSDGLVAAAIIALVLLTVVLLYFDARRFARSRVLPQLARALRPLEPTLEELTNIMSDLKRTGWALGRQLRPEEVFEATTQPVLEDDDDVL